MPPSLRQKQNCRKTQEKKYTGLVFITSCSTQLWKTQLESGGDTSVWSFLQVRLTYLQEITVYGDVTWEWKFDILYVMCSNWRWNLLYWNITHLYCIDHFLQSGQFGSLGFVFNLTLASLHTHTHTPLPSSPPSLSNPCKPPIIIIITILLYFLLFFVPDSRSTFSPLLLRPDSLWSHLQRCTALASRVTHSMTSLNLLMQPEPVELITVDWSCSFMPNT